MPAAEALGGSGESLQLQLDHQVAKLFVEGGAGQTQIEITPTGQASGEYFIATFDGPRIGALVRLNEDYDHVREIDLKLMVGAEHDVTGFPSIGLVGRPGSRRLRIADRGLATRLELAPFHAD